jgi:hypothetical protein
MTVWYSRPLLLWIVINGTECTPTYTPRLAAATWGVITTQLGEFIVPDVPSHTIFPLAPRLALVGFAPDGVINERNLAEINRAARRASQEYFFAHDLSNAPGCDVE